MPGQTTPTTQTLTLDFGLTSIVAFAERSFKITSAGDVDASSLSATLLGADADSFSIVGTPLPNSLSVGSSADLTIRFTPHRMGDHSAYLQITSSDPSMNPLYLMFKGKGTKATLELRDATNQVISSDPSHGNKVVAWGLGNSSTNRGQSDVPKGLSDVVAVAAGMYHSIALKQDGTVVAWGWNVLPQSTVPTGLKDVTAITAGYYHNLALKQDGSVAIWGESAPSPHDLSARLGKSVVAVSAGTRYSVALRRDGTVFAWGQNDRGQCDVPTGLSGVTAIASSTFQTLAVKHDGTVVGWGHAYPVGGKTYNTPYIPAGLTGVTAIATTGDSNVALKQDGTIVTWGRDRFPFPLPPRDLNHVVAVGVGLLGALALKEDGTVATWAGPLTAPRDLMGVQSIASGAFHSLAVVDAPGDFGERPLNTQRIHSLRLANTGGVQLETRATLEGPDADQFSIVYRASATTSRGDSSTLVYAFKPTRVGPLHAALKITSNDPAAPLTTIDLTGTGIYVSNNAVKPSLKGGNLILGPLLQDRSTGSLLQALTFGNSSRFALNGLRLVVSHVMPGVTIQSSSATRTVGTVEVIYSKPIGKGETVSLTLTYNDPLRRNHLQPTIHAESLAEPEPRDGPVDGMLTPLLNVRDTANGPLLEWNATAKKTYVVEYSDDAGQTWYSAVHRLLASGSRLVWTDRGQPETWSQPASKAARTYRVKQVR